jgi:hypothetical protein
MERTDPDYGGLSVWLAVANLAITPLADHVLNSPLASNSEAEFWRFAVVTLLGLLALTTLCIAWVILVGLALRRRERCPWLLALALVINVVAVYWWVANFTWRMTGAAA